MYRMSSMYTECLELALMHGFAWKTAVPEPGAVAGYIGTGTSRR